MLNYQRVDQSRGDLGFVIENVMLSSEADRERFEEMLGEFQPGSRACSRRITGIVIGICCDNIGSIIYWLIVV